MVEHSAHGTLRKHFVIIVASKSMQISLWRNNYRNTIREVVEVCLVRHYFPLVPRNIVSFSQPDDTVAKVLSTNNIDKIADMSNSNLRPANIHLSFFWDNPCSEVNKEAATRHVIFVGQEGRIIPSD